jgi:phage shock protein PspC (stress-responsive transcriptional regulator)
MVYFFDCFSVKSFFRGIINCFLRGMLTVIIFSLFISCTFFSLLPEAFSFTTDSLTAFWVTNCTWKWEGVLRCVYIPGKDTTIGVNMAFCQGCGAVIKEDAEFCPECGTKIVSSLESPPPRAIDHPPKFYRIQEGTKRYMGIGQPQGMIAGVCAGLARYYNMDPALVRIAFILGSFIYGIGLFTYLLIWILTPMEPQSGY